MCRAGGLQTWVGGNIGNPLITDLDQIGPDDWVVMELSSFQLEVMTISPHVAAILNITPNHLDRHKTMESYIAAKRNILAHQRPEDFALLGYDDANARSLAIETAVQAAMIQRACVTEIIPSAIGVFLKAGSPRSAAGTGWLGGSPVVSGLAEAYRLRPVPAEVVRH